MACLDVETPAVCRGKFRSVLQLRLQQRRTREQLVEQGIMAPLKSPAAFHEQIRSLERARTENFLKHKISSRPERSELVRMHILQETLAEPSLQATQLRLKRARLADDLNEKIAQRPGPMELVEKNILPVDSSLKEAIIDPEIGEMNYPKTRDVYAFDEDSGDALSPGLPASQESQGSVASPGELKIPEASSPQTISTLQFYPPISQPTAEYLKAVSTNEQPVSRMSPVSQPVATAAPSKPGPTLVKQSQPKQPGDKSRSKKGKEAKPRVKKLKYHQYIPPDQKQEPTEAPMDSSYARLLQQQQLFLQLQILSQQQQHYNYQTILPASLKQVTDGQNSSSSVALNNNSGLSPSVVVSLPTAATSRPNHTLTNRKPGLLPSNLDEMKVAELKTELKIRGLPVSGTKTDLIERLRPYQEVSTNASSTPPNAGLADKQHFSPSQQGAPEIMSSTPPVSPGASDLSNLSTEEMATADCPSEGLKPPPGSTPRGSALEEGASETRARDKDLRLHEKERQIKELTRKLEQEQRLVEALKMQLEVEKRSQQGGQPSEPSTPAPVKVENGGSANCSAAQPATVKQEQPLPRAQTATLPQFFISREQATQVLRQPQILLPVSHPANLATIQLPSNSLGLQTQSVLQASVPTQAPGLAQTSGPRVQLQKTETSAVPPPTQTQHVTQTFPVCTTSNPAFQYSPNLSQTAMEIPQSFLNSSPESRSPARTSPSHAVLNGPTNKPPSPSQPTFILQQSTFTNHTPKSKDPPRYEEAVKQTRSLQTPRQVPTATSQQMDDLFDILIESGEISPFIRQDPPSSAKTLTANITTLPISTALSRPPPQVQVAPRPAPILVALASDNQLEAFLEGALAGGGEPRTLRVMEELNCQLLDQPNSPMDTSDLSFTDGSPPSAFHLSDTNLDNMEWLDLTIPGPAEGLNQLGVPPAGGVFSTDFLDAHDLQLHWD